MVKISIDRRRFVTDGARAGLSLCGLCACSGLPLFAAGDEAGNAAARIDPKELNFCSYVCPEDRKFLRGTLDDDIALRREAFAIWKLEERFGLEFDLDTSICYGCKELGTAQGMVVSNCDVRACARERQHDCCIECGELEECDKDLWRRFPDFKAQVVRMQIAYRRQQAGTA